MPGELTAKGKVVGLKQTRRALVQGAAAHVYLACDADPRLTDPLRVLCAEKAIPCDSSMTLRQSWVLPAVSPCLPPLWPS